MRKGNAMDENVHYIRARNNGERPKKREAVSARTLVGLWLMLLLSYVTQDGPETNEAADYGRKVSQSTTDIIDSFRDLVIDQSNAKVFFDNARVDQWTCSVVAIGIHEPMVGSYSWYHRRTGFSVNSRFGGRLIASYDVGKLASGQYRIHAHPFLLPPAENSQAVHLRAERVVSYLQPEASNNIPLVRLADWNDWAYEHEFPVVLIGFEDGLPVHFYTHSIGPADEPVRIKLASRPYGVFGEFCGAPVFNSKGEVVGIYAPQDNTPTYLVSSVMQ
jgi:hypothetical protein